MELHQLRYFSRAAKYESLSKAAADLHISQPALSKSISKLESEMGIDLFDRTGNRFVLTDSGRYFQSRVDHAIRDLEDSAQVAKNMAASVRETVVTGIFGTQRPALECISAFMLDFPDVQVTMRSKQQFKTQPILHEFDAVFYPANSSFDSLAGIPYANTSLKVILPLGHRLSKAESVTIDELRDERFIMLESTTGIMDTCYRLCEEAGFYPQVCAIVTSRVAQSYLVSAGLGVGLTDGLLDASKMEDFATVDLETDMPGQQLCVAFRPASSLSPAALHFMEFAKSHFGIE